MRHGLRVQANGLSLAIAADVGNGPFDSSGDVEEMELVDAHYFCDALSYDERKALFEELQQYEDLELEETIRR